MPEFMQSMNFPTDTILQYTLVIVWVILAIIIAKIVSWLVGSWFKKAVFIKNIFWKIWVTIDMEFIWNIISKTVYFIIIFVWVVWILKYLDIEIKLVNDILDIYLPKILNAWGLAIIAIFLATITKAAIQKSSKTIDLNNKIGSVWDISESISVIAYWSIIIFFLPQILEKLGQNELLKPITNIIDSITWYIPNIIWAAIIFVIWLFIAKIVKQITVSILESFKVDKASTKIGLKDFSISSLAWTIVYVLILLPVAIQALDKLQIEVISWPATEMLQTIINIIPLLLTAWIIIVISYFIWKFVSKLVTDLLAWIWFDKILQLIGLKNIKSSTKPSEIIWSLSFFYILLLAIVEAANTIWFENMSGIVNELILFVTNILIWIVILGLGLFLANVTEKAIKSASSSKLLPAIAKTAIIVLTAFMWLQQMWIGWEIINQAFTLLLWAVAVAFALAVWLWAKDVAWTEVKNFIENIKK